MDFYRATAAATPRAKKGYRAWVAQAAQTKCARAISLAACSADHTRLLGLLAAAKAAPRCMARHPLICLAWLAELDRYLGGCGHMPLPSPPPPSGTI